MPVLAVSVFCLLAALYVLGEALSLVVSLIGLVVIISAGMQTGVNVIIIAAIAVFALLFLGELLTIFLFWKRIFVSAIPSIFSGSISTIWILLSSVALFELFYGDNATLKELDYVTFYITISAALVLLFTNFLKLMMSGALCSRSIRQRCSKLMNEANF